MCPEPHRRAPSLAVLSCAGRVAAAVAAGRRRPLRRRRRLLRIPDGQAARRPGRSTPARWPRWNARPLPTRRRRGPGRDRVISAAAQPPHRGREGGAPGAEARRRQHRAHRVLGLIYCRQRRRLQRAHAGAAVRGHGARGDHPSRARGRGVGRGHRHPCSLHARAPVSAHRARRQRRSTRSTRGQPESGFSAGAAVAGAGIRGDRRSEERDRRRWKSSSTTSRAWRRTLAQYQEQAGLLKEAAENYTRRSRSSRRTAGSSSAACGAVQRRRLRARGDAGGRGAGAAPRRSALSRFRARALFERGDTAAARHGARTDREGVSARHRDAVRARGHVQRRRARRRRRAHAPTVARGRRRATPTR